VNDTPINLDQTEGGTFTSEVSDESLEAAAGTEGGHSLASSFNLSSYHLSCC
jgi:hypothetical protein